MQPIRFACSTTIHKLFEFIDLLFRTTRDPGLREEHDRLIARVRTELGEADFAAAWAAGYAMDLAQAVAYALGVQPLRQR